MSETTNLKLKKHDNPETNTEKFDIENYLNGNWDKIDKNVGEVNTNISNINSKNKEQDTNIGQLQENTETSSNKIAELEKELKEAQEDFYQNSIRGQASGEYIHVEDSSNCRSIIGISGNHEQETSTQNENLLILEDGTQTLNGVTMAIKDGIITFNGTATASTFFKIKIKEKLKAGDYYHLAAQVSGSHTKNIALGVVDVEEKTRYSEFNGGGGHSFNLTNDEYITYRIWVENGNVINNQIYKCMISKGTESKEWVKGIPNMPSPDYLSSIVAVGSNVNEFDIDTVKDGFLNEKTGEIISNNSWKCSDFIEILNKTYTFGWESSSDYFQVNVCYYDENKKFLSGKSYGFRGTFNNTFEVVSNAKYMKIAYSVSVSGELVTREKIKLEKGTVATQWSQHGQGCVKVTKCNKNIMPILNLGNNYKYTENGIKSLKRNDGVEVTRFKVKKGQTIKFGLKLFSRPTQDTSWTIYFDNLGIASFAHLENSSSFDLNKVYEKTYTASEDGDIFIKLWGNASSDVFEFQLWAELNTLTDYVQHEEQSYIMPVQQEMLQGDYFDFDNEKEEHKWIKLIFDGTENWLQSGNTYPTFYISPYEITSKFGIPAGLKAFCNYFSQKSNIWGIDEIGFDTANLRQDHVDFRFCLGSSSTITTLEAWKKKLVEMHNSGKPLALYFQILNLNELDFTDEQKAVAKELNNARTYKNVTNITTDSKAILSLDYAKDLETLLTSKESEV